MTVRRLINLAALVLMLAIALVLVSVFVVRRTIPPDRERRAVAGLEAALTIDYDARGVPTLRGTNDRDLAFGQGYAHARDRRFQMEMFRRNAAGRLAEVVGAAALPLDRRFRTFGFVPVADTGLARMNPVGRARFEAYAAGVNAWDAAHPAPPEFAILRIPREPWQPRDGLLVLLLMFEQLNDTGEQEIERERMDATLPAALVAFMTPEGTPLDVPLDGSAPPVAPATPGPGIVNVRDSSPHHARTGSPTAGRAPAHEPVPVLAGAMPAARAANAAAFERAWNGERLRGSNNWAIAPGRTTTGGALLAGDPHLGLDVPVIWHRQRLEGDSLHITGVTLPGLPGVVIGSNGDVAWSFTNVEGDLADLVRVSVSDADTTSYRGPGGDEPFRVRTEIIAVKGAAPETLRVRETRWGPVIAPSAAGGLLALQWAALDPLLCDTDLFGMNRATSVEELFARAHAFRGPPQNMVAADRSGHIGWVIAGWIPRRAGYDPRRPRAGDDPRAGWTGYIDSDSLPRVLDPADGFITTANQRTLNARWTATIGSGYAMPWRARRVHEQLAARSDWSVDAVSALQNDLDDAFLNVTASALNGALTPGACAADPALARVRRVLDGWTHRADTTSVAHAYLRMARLELNLALQKPLVAPCVASDSSFAYSWSLADEVSRRLLVERPLHLLDPDYANYDALVRASAVRALGRLEARAPGRPADSISWGRINRAAIRHPIGRAAPALARLLNMPPAALAGGSSVVRVASPRNGASLRMIADLAAPERSRFIMPGGQSGHFLSPNYSDQFGDWVAGATGSLEPGPRRNTLELRPAPR